MKVERFVESLAERVGASTGVKVVYGEPIEAAGKTIIPVAKVVGGFGGGGGDPSNGEGANLGGGGGMKATPVGVVEITQQRTQFIPLSSTKAILTGAAIGFLAALLLRRK